MLKSFSKKCALLLCLVSLLIGASSASAVTEREGHGGDPHFRMRWYAVRELILKSWTPAWKEWLGMEKREFERGTEPGFIELLEVDSIPNGLAARNFQPNSDYPLGRIEVLESWWESTERSMTERLLLVLHEYLSFWGMDRNYELTRQALAFRNLDDDGRIFLNNQEALSRAINRALNEWPSQFPGYHSRYINHKCGADSYQVKSGRKLDGCTFTIGITHEVVEKAEKTEIATVNGDVFGSIDFKTRGDSTGFILRIALPKVSSEEDLLEIILRNGALTVELKPEYKDGLVRMHQNLLFAIVKSAPEKEIR